MEGITIKTHSLRKYKLAIVTRSPHHVSNLGNKYSVHGWHLARVHNTNPQLKRVVLIMHPTMAIYVWHTCTDRAHVYPSPKISNEISWSVRVMNRCRPHLLFQNFYDRLILPRVQHLQQKTFEIQLYQNEKGNKADSACFVEHFVSWWGWPQNLVPCHWHTASLLY